jgi:hypothetical protein
MPERSTPAGVPHPSSASGSDAALDGALLPPHRAGSEAPAGPRPGRRTTGRFGDARKGGDAGCLGLCHVDEAGFALTQPTTTTWGAVGCPRPVSYQAPQGRRLKVIGAYFSHRPEAGWFDLGQGAVAVAGCCPVQEGVRARPGTSDALPKRVQVQRPGDRLAAVRDRAFRSQPPAVASALLLEPDGVHERLPFRSSGCPGGAGQSAAVGGYSDPAVAALLRPEQLPQGAGFRREQIRREGPGESRPARSTARPSCATLRPVAPCGNTWMGAALPDPRVRRQNPSCCAVERVLSLR